MVANLTQGTPPKPYGKGGRRVFRDLTSAAQVWQGAMVAEASGQVVTATTAGSGPVIGVSEMDAYGSTGPVDGTDDSQRISILYDQIFEMSPDTSSPPTEDTPFGTPLYATSDNTVGTSPGAYFAGLFQGMTDNGNVYVMINPSGLSLALGGEEGGAAATAASTTARAVATQIPAYTGTTTGVLTASATGVFGAVDGVTLALGDVVLVPEGITNLSAASDAGPYQVTTLGASGVKWVLTRVAGWATGQAMTLGASVKIGGEGTLFGGTTWKSFAAKGSVVDTTAPALYPEKVTQQITLLTGTSGKAITNVPIRSATASSAIATYVSGTAASTTVSYGQGVITPGTLTTATVTIHPYAEAMAVVASGDTSVLNVTILN